ncbi:hypothetical protein RB195_017620 [Necator americanus]|uniref:Uncharacterized protein n=1 Tax=Necator americanus TaxID=51031 RepID=A0ABR1C615_NECAM
MLLDEQSQHSFSFSNINGSVCQAFYPINYFVQSPVLPNGWSLIQHNPAIVHAKEAGLSQQNWNRTRSCIPKGLISANRYFVLHPLESFQDGLHLPLERYERSQREAYFERPYRALPGPAFIYNRFINRLHGL